MVGSQPNDGRLNRPGESGALLISALSRRVVSGVERQTTSEFDRREIAAVFAEAATVEPVDPACGGQLDVLHGPPGLPGLISSVLYEISSRLVDEVVWATLVSVDGRVSAGVMSTGPLAAFALKRSVRNVLSIRSAHTRT